MFVTTHHTNVSSTPKGRNVRIPTLVELNAAYRDHQEFKRLSPQIRKDIGLPADDGTKVTFATFLKPILARR